MSTSEDFRIFQAYLKAYRQDLSPEDAQRFIDCKQISTLSSIADSPNDAGHMGDGYPDYGTNTSR